MNAPPRISVAVALFNEEAVLPELLRRTLAVLDTLPGGPHELVLVDDGSRDRTAEILATAANADVRLAVVTLSRNFGQQMAVTAALDHARGDVVVVMDGDLQDAPEVIPQFLERHAQGYDVVYAVRLNRKEGLLLRWGYAAFYRVISRLADIHLPIGAGDFALVTRRVVAAMQAAPERHRYVRGLRTWVGFRQTGIAVERDARQAGRSKYGLRTLFRLACDGIFAFSLMPLRLSTMLGGLAVLASFAFALYSVYARLVLHQSPQGFTALIVAITFLSGVQLLTLGILGEYLGRVYEEVKQRPRYVVDKVVRSER